MNYTKLGEMLLKHRFSVGLEQWEVAKAIKVSQQSICRWEAGYCRPRLLKMRLLINVLKIEKIELFYKLAGYVFETQKTQKYLINYIGQSVGGSTFYNTEVIDKPPIRWLIDANITESKHERERMRRYFLLSCVSITDKEAREYEKSLDLFGN